MYTPCSICLSHILVRMPQQLVRDEHCWWWCQSLHGHTRSNDRCLDHRKIQAPAVCYQLSSQKPVWVLDRWTSNSGSTIPEYQNQKRRQDNTYHLDFVL